MSLSSMLGKAGKVVVRTAVLPVAVAVDVARWFDPYDNSESETVRNLSESTKDVIDLPEELER
jgi:hypothetical protein